MTTSRRCATRIVVAVLLNTLPALAAAQSASSTEAGIADLINTGLAAQLEREWAAAPSETFTAHQDPIVLEAGQANGKGTLILKPKDDCMLDAVCWNVQLSAPIDKKSEVTDFTNLDGLAKDFKITFERRWSPGLDSKVLDDFFQDIDALCDALGLCDSCDEHLVAKTLRERSPAQIAGLPSVANFAAKARRAVTLAGSLSQNSYKFFESDSAKEESDELGFSVRAAYSAPIGALRWAASVTAERSYSDGKTAATLCADIDESVLKNCDTRPLGAPAESETVILRAELRENVHGVIVSPMVAYDTQKDVWGLELPFYMLRDSKGHLTGGMRIGWRSDTDEVQASIFVSKPLTFSLVAEK